MKYACVYVTMYVCMYVCMQICVYVNMIFNVFEITMIANASKRFGTSHRTIVFYVCMYVCMHDLLTCLNSRSNFNVFELTI